MRLKFLFLILIVSFGLIDCRHRSRSFGNLDALDEKYDQKSLANYAKPLDPRQFIPANSEQRQPLQLGTSYRDLIFGQPAATTPRIPEFMKKLAEDFAVALAKDLKQPALQFEIWPIEDFQGLRSWAFSRWRVDQNDAWTWLNASEDFPRKRFYKGKRKRGLSIQVMLPTKLNARKDRKELFADFLEFEDLYDKAEFGNCFWVDERSDHVKLAWKWADFGDLKDYEEKITDENWTCYSMYQPPVLNWKPITFSIAVKNGEVRWLQKIDWQKDIPDSVAIETQESRIKNWQNEQITDFAENFREDLSIFSGEKTISWQGRDVAFKKKNSAETDHQLEQLLDYYESRYQGLGLETWRQRFKWRGIDESNLIAIIPGSLPKEQDRPVIFSDHVDTAFAEDHYEKTHERVSTPGADDNGTAVVSLLQAAKLLAKSKPKNSIWLVHLTGEEYPGDDLGVRYFVSYLLKEKINVKGLVLIDMIGFRVPGDDIFQINGGDDSESLKLSAIAFGAAKYAAPELNPKYRSRFSDGTYLYNTDGIIFSDKGFPVVYFNEHTNRRTRDSNIHYHQSTDSTSNIDFTYAVPISKTAIETVARFAN